MLTFRYKIFTYVFLITIIDDVFGHLFSRLLLN